MVAYGSKTFSLNAKTNGGGKLSYKSSNKRIANVSQNGKVTVKNYGQTTITIKAATNGKYATANIRITIKVVPKKMVLKKMISPRKKKIKITWKKDKTVTGYNINLCLRKDFKRGTLERFCKLSEKFFLIQGVKSKKTYYVRVRGYKKVGNKTYYGAWSKTKSVKVK
ncbi:MAG: Ig-like domain-containing protein [Lachnospiraceae bacterium]|nr:Ig-like domain-containing protein [Lachnospiraceae bacterium]